MPRNLSLLLCLALLFCAAFAAHAQAPQTPPARVVAAPVRAGLFAPTALFVGTVYFNELAELASETAGLVESYSFSTGDRVRKGQVLVRLNTDILTQDLRAAQAELAQARTTLEQARKDDERLSKLIASGAISEQEHDNQRFLRLGLEKRVHSLQANVRGIELSIAKAVIAAPFDGVVLKRSVNRGEWLDKGGQVAEIGRDDVLDVLADVPQSVPPHLPADRTAEVEVAGRRLTATDIRLVPRGDVATRTFPLKMTLKNPGFLAQGMEARVTLPTGPAVDCLIVPRDAVLTVMGQTAVWAVRDGQAAMVPVQPVGFKGFEAGVRAQGLADGDLVVTKGNERLRPGQPLQVDGN